MICQICCNSCPRTFVSDAENPKCPDCGSLDLDRTTPTKGQMAFWFRGTPLFENCFDPSLLISNEGIHEFAAFHISHSLSWNDREKLENAAFMRAYRSGKAGFEETSVIKGREFPVIEAGKDGVTEEALTSRQHRYPVHLHRAVNGDTYTNKEGD